MIYFLQLLQEHHHEEPQQPQQHKNNNNELKCDQCNNPLKEWGHIHIQQLDTTKQITFICSKRCRYKSQYSKACLHCGKDFTTQKRNFVITKYCSRKCRTLGTKVPCGNCINCGDQIKGFEKNKRLPKQFCSKKCAGQNRKLRYDHFYFCDNCTCWIPIKDSVKINNSPTCPKMNCNHNKLKTRSTKCKFNNHRKQVKYIE
jgi:hypothetical protein